MRFQLSSRRASTRGHEGVEIGGLAVLPGHRDEQGQNDARHEQKAKA
jgi:hypothetical protein